MQAMLATVNLDPSSAGCFAPIFQLVQADVLRLKVALFARKSVHHGLFCTKLPS